MMLPQDSQSRVSEVLDSLTPEQFQAWYRNRQYRQNIENGQPYFNGVSSVPPPERHSPSKLLQCHRKIAYRQDNAPEEDTDPDGIFWFGTRFEEDIVFPFFREVLTDEDTYVRNSVWIDFTLDTDVGNIHIKGATDPLIVDADGVPILPAEIKTKRSVKSVTSPSRHHRAQLHAYMKGLSEKYETYFSDGVLVYGSRETLDVETFHVEFDESFWEDVVMEWATDHTEYRLGNELPPGEPEADWECQFCSYRERCGKGDTSNTDLETSGFLPGYRDYPREKVVQYLESNPSERLTPTLAQQYPKLANQHGSLKWSCHNCTATISVKRIENPTEPLCPSCADRGELSHLSLRAPDDAETSATPLTETGEQL